LPDWARATLDKHASDTREQLYSIDELARAETSDDVWNAAQRQLVAEGRIHNYLRMIWGKRVLEWTKSPEKALEILIELNNRYAVDGRDPNSYSGIFWIFGRYDRPWAPERKYFGTIRYMSSARTKTKLAMKAWLARWS
jgi:deoxyribodipyrimidine photo-lyase